MPPPRVTWDERPARLMVRAPQELMLQFSSTAPELERLNELGYRLPLSDAEIKSLQNLNRTWTTASTQTTERFRY